MHTNPRRPSGLGPWCRLVSKHRSTLWCPGLLFWGFKCYFLEERRKGRQEI